MINLKERFAKAIFLKPRVNLLEWSEKYRVLSQESSAVFGRFKALPYQKEVLVKISQPTTQEVVLLWSSQVGKSEMVINTTGYYIHQDPSSILILLPTEDMAEDYSKRRLAPMFRDTKVVGDLIHDREANNTILIKNFKGGNLALVGSNSPSKLASKPIKVLLVDELDRCENTKEGYSVDLAQKRTTTFYDKKIIKVSTPTLKNHSPIKKEFDSSARHFFQVPCPECQTYQELDFKQIKWNTNADGSHDLESVAYACVECGCLWSESAKNKAVEKGVWVCKDKERLAGEHLKLGYFLNAIYSPFLAMKDIVKDFLASKNDPAKLQVFTNTILAKTYEPPSIKFADVELFNRREDYTPTTLPNDVVFLTAGADIQGDRIEIEVRGFGRAYENWGVEHLVIYGDTKESSVWQKAYAALKKRYYTKDGRNLGISIALIDSGYNRDRVYNLVSLDPRFFATKGKSEGETKSEFVTPSKKVAKGVRLFNIGTYKGKSEVFELLRVAEVGAGYCHFPLSYSLEYFQELTAEKIVTTKNQKGYQVSRWEKVRERNEALDLFVLCLAGAKVLKIDSLK